MDRLYAQRSIRKYNHLGSIQGGTGGKGMPAGMSSVFTVVEPCYGRASLHPGRKWTRNIRLR